MSLRSGDVIWVEFPFVEVEQVKSRPALVISARPLGPDDSLVWTLMITNAKRPSWTGDVAIEVLDGTGLPVPSKVRTAKIATSEVDRSRRIGRLAVADHKRVMEKVRCILPDC